MWPWWCSSPPWSLACSQTPFAARWAHRHIVAKPVDPVAREQIIAGNAGDADVATVAIVQTAPRKIRSIDNWRQIMAAFEAVPAVVAASPMASGPAIALRGEGRNAVTVFGIDLARYDQIVDLRDKLAAGTLRLEPGEVLVGVELARDLGADVGDRITVTDGSPAAGGERFRWSASLTRESRSESPHGLPATACGAELAWSAWRCHLD